MPRMPVNYPENHAAFLKKKRVARFAPIETQSHVRRHAVERSIASAAA